eukprot:352907-Chlamydomonas_euryale.AAC.2
MAAPRLAEIGEMGKMGKHPGWPAHRLVQLPCHAMPDVKAAKVAAGSENRPQGAVYAHRHAGRDAQLRADCK